MNSASQCGHTPQYAGLQQLYARLKDRGFEILAFPCDQFGHQEPGTDEEIQQFCQLNYGVSFPMMSKVEVNGASAHPLWQWLKSQLAPPARPEHLRRGELGERDAQDAENGDETAQRSLHHVTADVTRGPGCRTSDLA